MIKIRNRFSVTNVQSLLYPCATSLRILGLLPFKRENSKYVFSRVHSIWSVAIILMIVPSFIISLYKLNFPDSKNHTSPEVIYINFFYLLIGTEVFVTCSLYRGTLSIIQSLYELSESLSPKDMKRISVFIYTKDILGPLFLLCHLPNCYSSNYFLSLRLIITLYLLLANLLFTLGYINCVYIVKACFRKLNENLERLKIPLAKKSSDLEELCTQKTHNIEQSSVLMITILKNMQKKYLRISDFIRLLNKTYRIHILATTILTFTGTIYNLYFYILWMAGMPLNKKEQLWYIPFLSSAIYHLVKFTLLVCTCDSAKNEAMKINTTIHDFSNDITDPTVKRELQLFSLQILHHDNSFNAKLITLNGALLVQILGGITMYILILIQFLLDGINNWIKSKT